jgi:hypothetical protein
MEAVAVAIMVLFPAGIAGAIGYAVVQYQKHVREARAQAFARVGQQLGLMTSAEGVSGAVGGVPVAATLDYRSQGKSTVTYTVVRARLHPPLDLGLSLRDQNWAGLGSLEALFHSAKDHQLGDPLLDAALLIGGDEPHRIDALLSRSVRPLLIQAARAASLIINDGWVQIEEQGEPRDAFLLWALDASARIAHELDASRYRVPLATSLGKLAHGYSTAAGVLGLTWMPTPLALAGNIEGIQVYSGAYRVAPHRYEALASAVFPTPLGLGLDVRSTRSFNALDRLFMAKDVRLGDDRFDETFIVRGADQARLAHVFSK